MIHSQDIFHAQEKISFSERFKASCLQPLVYVILAYMTDKLAYMTDKLAHMTDNS
jgi:hypothetical protein